MNRRQMKRRQMSRQQSIRAARQTLILLAVCGAIILPPRLSGQGVPGAAPAPVRQIALTVDDLPAMDAASYTAPEITAMNRQLIAAIKAAKAPAIGFVIEQTLYKTGEVDARIAALNLWLDAGLSLGNHTYSHTSLNQVELKDWEDDVVQGETVTKTLLAPRHMELRYLRHPYLDVGPDLRTRRDAEAFLTARGYRVAPVTIDGRDWFFADLYADARRHADQALKERIVTAWLVYAAAILDYDEQLSRSLLGYEPKQVLLTHDCWLEAEHLPELLALLRSRGYSFISLDAALTDPAYAQPDDYVSDVGASWLEHWAVTRGQPSLPTAKPQVPQWAEEAHQKLDAAAAAN